MKSSIDADAKKFIKFDSWAQTNSDITVILHAGRPLKTNDISVEFNDTDVKVGLTDGRKWSCHFSQLVIRERCKVQLRKMKIHLTVIKKVPGFMWQTLQADGDSCNVAAVSSSKQSEHVGMSHTKSAPVVEQARVIEQPSVRSGTSQGNKSNTVITNDSEQLFRSKSDIVHTGCQPGGRQQLLSGGTGGMAGDSTPGALVRDMAVDHTVNDFSAPSDNVPTSLISFVNQLNSVSGMPCHPRTDIGSYSSEESVTGNQAGQAPGLSEDGVRASQSYADLTSSVVSMDVDCAPVTDNAVHVLTTLRHEFYETTEKVVVEVYVKKIEPSALRVSFKPMKLSVVFQTSDMKFCETEGVSVVDTTFSWSIDLANTINENKCNFKLFPTKIVITLAKLKAVKWDCLQNLSAQETVFPADDQQVHCTKQTGSEVAADSELTNVEPKGSSSNSQQVWEKDQLKYQSSNKPTCRVTPLSSEDGIGSVSGCARMTHRPGWTGLDNLGNTCFMNSVLQVLANTAELKAYFMGGLYERDINKVNPLGMKGDMAKSFAQMVAALWSGTRSSFMPSKIKTLLAMKQTRFTGYLQHDAEEFMEFLLDGLHEYFTHRLLGGHPAKYWSPSNVSSTGHHLIHSIPAMTHRPFKVPPGLRLTTWELNMKDLNRIINKPYSEQEADHSGKLEQVIADEQWKTHLARNDSHIVDTFQGQFRSKLMCPVCNKTYRQSYGYSGHDCDSCVTCYLAQEKSYFCGKQVLLKFLLNKVSVKFDPFSVLSVPIPKKKKLLNVLFVPRNLRSRLVKYQLLLETSARIKNLKEALCLRTQVNPNQLRVMEVRQSRVVNMFDKEAKVTMLNENSQIIAFEVVTSNLVGEPVKEMIVQQSAALPLVMLESCSFCHAHPKPDVLLKRCGKCFRTAYCNQLCQKNDWSQHKASCKRYRDAVGCPFIISLPVSQITYRNLYELLDKYARYWVNTFQPPSRCANQSQQTVMDVTRVLKSGGFSGDSSDSVSGLTLEAVDIEDSGDDKISDKAVRHVMGLPQNPIPVLPKPPFSIEIGSVSTVDDATVDKPTIVDKGDELWNLESVTQLEMVWNNNDKSDHSVMVETKLWDSLAEVTEKLSSADKNRPVTLNDCLQLFCEPELLAADQTWNCPRCKLSCRATKELSVWRMPCNLIIQIKRFSFANVLYRSKIEEFVDFPIKSLDMGAYFKSVKTEEYDIGDRTEHLYDLYGVINHYGGMLGGHYTSFARTPDLMDTTRNELDWRQFDDGKVTSITESSVVTKAAYVLFYRRRDQDASRSSLSAGASIPKEVPVMDDCDLETSEEREKKNKKVAGSDRSGYSSSEDVKQRVLPTVVYNWTDMEDID